MLAKPAELEELAETFKRSLQNDEFFASGVVLSVTPQVTTEVTTQWIVPSGRTVLIGGLIKRNL